MEISQSNALSNLWLALPFAGLPLDVFAPNRRFEFEQRSQLFICAYDQALSIVPVCVNNPGCSSALNSRLRHSPSSIPLYSGCPR
jgi:hypothetical protein